MGLPNPIKTIANDLFHKKKKVEAARKVGKERRRKERRKDRWREGRKERRKEGRWEGGRERRKEKGTALVRCLQRGEENSSVVCMPHKNEDCVGRLYVNLRQARVTWEEGTSAEKL